MLPTTFPQNNPPIYSHLIYFANKKRTEDSLGFLLSNVLKLLKKEHKRSFMNIFSTYSLNHCRSVLQKSYRQIEKNLFKLNTDQKKEAHTILEDLEKALKEKNRRMATKQAKGLQEFCSRNFPKSSIYSSIEFILALLFALAIAMFVRAIWFELYEIPTGSMRPTFKEQDHLTVSKTQFGINIPMKTAHFYFDPHQVQRTGIVIFSGDKLPFIDSYTNFLGVFPYKKRYIKRLIGKPGDTLYYYGGQIYGIDQEGQEIQELLHSPFLEKLEYIPFLSFAGIRALPKTDEIVFEQTKQPLARLKASSEGLKGEIFNGKEWVTDHLDEAKSSHKEIKTLGDIWGIGNYAMVELVSKEELEKEGIDPKQVGDGVLYLLLRHNPSMHLSNVKAINNYFLESLPEMEKSAIALQQKHLDAIMDNMYTARFVVKDGKAKRYSLEENLYTSNHPTFANVPDGTYEFYYGKGNKVLFGGWTKEISKESPLYSHDAKNVKKLFNYGINFDLNYGPDRRHPQQLPNRYAYFKNGDLYLLGSPILKKEDPELKHFIENEKKLETESSEKKPYLAFIDRGPPMKNGQIDREFIKTFGLKIPEKHYLVLGDNHAMSADSRVFGFVPEDNLQGVPDLILWPDPGFPKQKPYHLFVFSRIVIWIIAALVLLIWYFARRYYLTRPIDLSKIK